MTRQPRRYYRDRRHLPAGELLDLRLSAPRRPKKEMPMSVDVLKSAAVRAARTFVQAFLAIVSAGAIGVVDVPTARALVVAAGSAALAAAWCTFLDTTAVPSLVDRNATAGVTT